MVEQELIDRIIDQYALDVEGVHGLPHWQRVRENGLRLAAETGAKPLVVELFACLHDSQRRNDRRDPGHGARAAEFVEALQGTHLRLEAGDLDHLLYACTYHTDGLVRAHVTVQTCWDADRLDLGRVGIKPDARYLCTEAAKRPEVIDWAYRRSRRNKP